MPRRKPPYFSQVETLSCPTLRHPLGVIGWAKALLGHVVCVVCETPHGCGVCALCIQTTAAPTPPPALGLSAQTVLSLSFYPANSRASASFPTNTRP